MQKRVGTDPTFIRTLGTYGSVVFNLVYKRNISGDMTPAIMIVPVVKHTKAVKMYFVFQDDPNLHLYLPDHQKTKKDFDKSIKWLFDKVRTLFNLFLIEMPSNAARAAVTIGDGFIKGVEDLLDMPPWCAVEIALTTAEEVRPEGTVKLNIAGKKIEAEFREETIER